LLGVGIVDGDVGNAQGGIATAIPMDQADLTWNFQKGGLV